MKRSHTFRKIVHSEEAKTGCRRKIKALERPQIVTQIDTILETCKSWKFDKDCTAEVKCVRKKTPSEIKFLEEMFLGDPDWSSKTVQICKKMLDLSTDQVYKWGYDKKLQLRKKSKKSTSQSMIREISMELKREVFLAADLKAYVSDLVDWYNNCSICPSLNDVSLILQEAEKAASKASKITKILCVAKSKEISENHRNCINDKDLSQYTQEESSYPFRPFHKSSQSLFEDFETISRCDFSRKEEECYDYQIHQNSEDLDHLCYLSDENCPGKDQSFLPDFLRSFD
ncbi:unnamed protein product [Moneuplotes crassus]|uniref:Homeobox domain-containing protein n=1 Tax=Euplotes crassus TaxID=5936 RepID=A0AAD2CYM8_EUPCR|nr:unnamed protein product [Moneuplotes crassus]